MAETNRICPSQMKKGGKSPPERFYHPSIFRTYFSPFCHRQPSDTPITLQVLMENDTILLRRSGLLMNHKVDGGKSETILSLFPLPPS